MAQHLHFSKEMTRPLTTSLVDASQRALEEEAADGKLGVGGCKTDHCVAM